MNLWRLVFLTGVLALGSPGAQALQLGGVTSSLGLSWLAERLGLGEQFAPWLLVGLLALAGLLLMRWLMRSRATATVDVGLVHQAPGQSPAPVDVNTPRGYSSKNVGNDASARPWEHEQAQGNGSVDSGEQPANGVPPDFDAEGFLQASKANFVSLQAAWDRSDIASLRAMMTDSMLEQIKSQLAEREQGSAGAANKTDVVMLEAHLLGIEELDHGYMASVEFSGLIREDSSSGPNPFREVWNITRPKAGAAGWLVAGVQALQ